MFLISARVYAFVILYAIRFSVIENSANSWELPSLAFPELSNERDNAGSG